MGQKDSFCPDAVQSGTLAENIIRDFGREIKIRGIRKGYVKTLSFSLMIAGAAMVGFGFRENLVLICASGFAFFTMLPIAFPVCWQMEQAIGRRSVLGWEPSSAGGLQEWAGESVPDDGRGRQTKIEK